MGSYTFKNVFDYYVETVNRLAPNTEWCGAGIGAGQILVNEWSIAAGGHTRTGLEDNIRLNKNELAKSNAQLVELAASLCEKYSRPIATHTQARQILSL
jgi:3-keto-5-aminohexanoate cleavage enzyme